MLVRSSRQGWQGPCGGQLAVKAVAKLVSRPVRAEQALFVSWVRRDGRVGDGAVVRGTSQQSAPRGENQYSCEVIKTAQDFHREITQPPRELF